MDQVKLSGDVIIILKIFALLRTLDLPPFLFYSCKMVLGMAGSQLGVRIFRIKEEQSPTFQPRDQKHSE